MQFQQKTDTAVSAKRSVLRTLFRKIGDKLAQLFEAEEVEVTFKVEGKRIGYTYTKVEHKQVA
jgi:hypothetical protein